MPKIIEDARQRILCTAKARLLTEGYHKLALRSIAKECGIAVGTIYNYFPSKEILIGSVMIEDWRTSLEDMMKSCEEAVNLMEGFRSIYNNITAFCDIYREVWAQSALPGNTKLGFSEHHMLLRNQIGEVVAYLLKRFGKQESESMVAFLAESLLTVVVQEDMDFHILSIVVGKIIV